MNGKLSQNAQAILLMTAPLLAGRARPSIRPLPLADYNNLVRHLRDTGMNPSDLLGSEGLTNLDDSWSRVQIKRTLEEVHFLLGRGLLLAQSLERWSERRIWVVTRADDDYPSRLRKIMREKAPPVLYGCGDRDALDGGGLAVIGSRKVNKELIEYTECVGHLAAAADVQIVSGGTRGVDQAAMLGSLQAGGRAIGVLGDNLERAALNRDNRKPLMDGRLVMVSSFDPAVRYRSWQAMECNKQIFALADAALVVNSDLGYGGTWAGATEQLEKLRYVPVYVRSTGEQSGGLDGLVARGAREWSEPKTPASFREIVFNEVSPVPKPVEWRQGELFPSELTDGLGEAVVPESAATMIDERKIVENDSGFFTESSVSTKNEMRLLLVMSGVMTRKEVCDALKLKNRSYVKKRFLDPCLKKGWIEMTLPEKPSSPKQRFRITSVGREYTEGIHGRESTFLVPAAGKSRP